MIVSLDALSADTRDAAHAWLDAAVQVVDADLRPALRDELVTALCEGLDADATVEQLARLVVTLTPRPPEGAGEGESSTEDSSLLTGSWFGIPYDFRPPTGDRLRASLWAPTDPRLFVPRAFGAGWDLNIGGLFVRLGLIEPDAEDEPFAATPHDAFVAAAAFPVLMAGAVLAHYTVRGRSLPARLSAHWGPAGRPDRWVGKGRAAATDLGLAAAGVGIAAAAVASRTHGAGRAGRLAAASGLAGAAAVLTVARPLPRGARWIGPALVAGVSGAPAATLAGLAYAGRAAERRRDLAPTASRQPAGSQPYSARP